MEDQNIKPKGIKVFRRESMVIKVSFVNEGSLW